MANQFCMECGARIDGKGAFCINCGAAFSAAAAVSEFNASCPCPENGELAALMAQPLIADENTVPAEKIIPVSCQPESPDESRSELSPPPDIVPAVSELPQGLPDLKAGQPPQMLTDMLIQQLPVRENELPTEAAPQLQTDQTPQNNSQIAERQYEGYTAAAVSGDMPLSPAAVQVYNEIKPVPYLRENILRAMQSIAGVFSDVRQIVVLIPAMVLGLLWMVVILLQANGINGRVVSVISYLTFARGGMHAGFVGLVGGLIGKALYAYLVTMLIVPLYIGANPFNFLLPGFRTLLDSLSVRKPATLIPLFAGAGLAFIFSNFVLGYSFLSQSMADIIVFGLSLIALSNPAGFMVVFLKAVQSTLAAGRSRNEETPLRLLAGMAAGYLLCVPASAIPFAFMHYMMGIAFVTASAVLYIVLEIMKGRVKV